jgi:hypothetical protein
LCYVLLHICPGKEEHNYIVVLFLVFFFFLKNHIIISIVAALIYSTTRCERIPIPHILTSICFLDHCHSDWREMGSQCPFDLQFRGTFVKYFFMPSFAIYVSSFEDCFQFICTFLNWIICPLLFCFLTPIYTLILIPC